MPDDEILENQPWAAPLVEKIRKLEGEKSALEKQIYDLKRKSDNQKGSIAELAAIADETQKFVADREQQISQLQTLLDKKSSEDPHVQEMRTQLEAAKEILQEQVDMARDYMRVQDELEKLKAEHEPIKKKAGELVQLLQKAQARIRELESR